jgi:hypothetical protein
MQGTNIPVLIVAAVATFVASVVQYTMFGSAVANLRGTGPAESGASLSTGAVRPSAWWGCSRNPTGVRVHRF